jgi:hypothetical protein
VMIWNAECPNEGDNFNSFVNWLSSLVQHFRSRSLLPCAASLVGPAAPGWKSQCSHHAAARMHASCTFASTASFACFRNRSVTANSALRKSHATYHSLERLPFQGIMVLRCNAVFNTRQEITHRQARKELSS